MPSSSRDPRSYETDPHLSEIIGLDVRVDNFTCQGYAKTERRQCKNPIRSTLGQVSRLLDQADEKLWQDKGQRKVVAILEEVAPLVLCSQWHRDQAPGFVFTWARAIHGFLRKNTVNSRRHRSGSSSPDEHSLHPEATPIVYIGSPTHRIAGRAVERTSRGIAIEVTVLSSRSTPVPGRRLPGSKYRVANGLSSESESDSDSGSDSDSESDLEVLSSPLISQPRRRGTISRSASRQPNPSTGPTMSTISPRSRTSAAQSSTSSTSSSSSSRPSNPASITRSIPSSLPEEASHGPPAAPRILDTNALPVILSEPPEQSPPITCTPRVQGATTSSSREPRRQTVDTEEECPICYSPLLTVKDTSSGSLQGPTVTCIPSATTSYGVNENESTMWSGAQSGTRTPPVTTSAQLDEDESIVWCRAQCGKNLHRACLEEWHDYCRTTHRDIRCPHCRSDWVAM